MRGGRRGTVSIMYEVVMSLLLLGFFAFVMYPYIDANATGEAFFSKFYAADLSTSAEIVNAPYGDVVLRYDNLKPSLDLTFWFTENGKVSVAKSPDPNDKWGVLSLTAQHKNLTYPVPGYATTEYYGLARKYPRPSVLVNPQFLALRKTGDAFGITEAVIVIASCDSIEPPMSVQEARPYISGNKRIREAFHDTLQETKLHTVSDETIANMKFNVKVEKGEPKIQVTSSTEKGATLSCIFRQKLELLTVTAFPVSGGVGTGPGLDMDVVVTGDVKDEDTGKALALALVEVFSLAKATATTVTAQPPPSTATCPITIRPWSGTDPYPVDWSGAKPELRQAYEAFNTALGSEQEIISVWRPQAYQDHIRSVWDAARFAKGESIVVKDDSCPNKGETLTPPDGWEACADLLTELEQPGGELDRHAARGDTRPACSSDHIEGIAMDLRMPVGTDYDVWRSTAEGLPGDLKLCHYIAGDEPHFGLAKYLAVSRCNVR